MTWDKLQIPQDALDVPLPSTGKPLTPQGRWAFIMAMVEGTTIVGYDDDGEPLYESCPLISKEDALKLLMGDGGAR